MSKPGYNVRYYEDGDEKQLVELFQTVFGEWPRFDIPCRKIDHWRWKFKDNPVGIAHIVVAETEEGKIVGASQAFLRRTKIGGNMHLVRKGAGVAVHSEYRRRGIYSQIMNYRESRRTDTGAVMSTSLTDTPAILKRKKRGEEDQREPLFPHPVRQLVKILNMDGFLEYYRGRGKIKEREAFLVRAGYPLLITLNKMSNLKSPHPRPVKDSAVKEINRFDQRVNHLWNVVKDGYDWITEKSEEYLNWRYSDSRGGNYKVWIAEEGEKLLGYVAVKVNKINPHHPIGYIMELLALENRVEVFSGLVKKVEAYLIEQDVDAIYYTVVKGHPYMSLMGRLGFIDTRRKPQLFYSVYSTSSDIEKFVNTSPERINYQFGEFDSI
jgi:GNAT superfamily N-acetyltransferase